MVAFMVAYVVIGAAIGLTFCLMVSAKEKDFKKKVVEECESRLKKGSATAYVSDIIQHKAQWKKSVSVVRKPFNKQINLAIEAVAFLFASLALINALVNFQKLFSSTVQGGAVLAFLGAVLAFIPCEWLMKRKIESQMDAFLEELDQAVKADRLKSYIREARKELGAG